VNDEHNSEIATSTLVELGKGDQGAAERLLPLVYDNLRRIAGHLMQNERAGHTLQPTAIVHETYLRLIQIDKVDWKDKAHFLALAARQMRRVLIDHARKKGAEKRGGDAIRVTLSESIPLRDGDATEIAALDEAMEQLSQAYPRPGQVAEFKIFGGLRTKEIEAILGVSQRTITDDWHFAKAWLARALGREKKT
jgi:RNA polymerase sigma factor (TIGR02999 family)